MFRPTRNRFDPAVLDVLPEIVATFDETCGLDLLNAVGRKFFGIPLGRELPPLILSDLTTDEEAERFVAEIMPRAIQNGLWSGRGCLRPLDALAPLPVRLRFAAHPGKGGKVRGFTLVASHVFLERADEGSREEVGRLVHDLNNLLGPILAHAELGLRDASEVGSTRRRFEVIQQAVLSARELCRRAAVRPGLTDWEVVDLATLCEEAVGLLRAEFPRSAISFARETGHCEVFGDPRDLQRALLNLCRNAAEALSGTSGAVRLSLSSVDGGKRLRLTVADDGQGIERQRLETIFEPYDSTKGSGRGLGLTQVREVVRQHGGSLAIESELGAGTRVHIEIPAHASKPTA